jgi:hypothetical protein
LPYRHGKEIKMIITTRKLPATSNQGARVSAILQGNRVTLPWNYDKDGAAAHEPAAREVASLVMGHPVQVVYIGSTETTYRFRIAGK